MKYQLEALDLSHVDAMLDVVRQWERRWELPMVTPRWEIAETFDSIGIDPANDLRGVFIDGDLAAFATVSHEESGVRHERAFINCYVAPPHAGRGIGRQLFAWQVERSRERLAATAHELPAHIRAHHWDWIEPDLDLPTHFGFEKVRWFQELVRPVDPGLDRAMPPTITIEPWETADAEEIRLVNNEAFADHWGSTPRSQAAWQEMLGEESNRLDLSFVATAEGRVIGYCLNSRYPEDDEVTGRSDAWIDLLATLRPWRKQGVASALIAAAIEAFRADGLSHAAIGVDADNPTGASALYRSLGFEPTHTTVASALQVR